MKRTNQQKTGLRVPGDLFIKRIQFGVPDLDGIYVCFYKPYPLLAHDNFPMAGIKIAHYSKGKWGCGEMVLAFLGPLPILSLDELANDQECVAKQFAIGTLKEAAKNEFQSNNHPQYIFAVLAHEYMKKGNFIFEVNSHKSMPVPLAKYNETTNTWEKIKETKQYLKTIQLLQRR